MATLEHYTDNWKEFFSQEQEVIRNILATNLIEIHHIGSTAVPGLMIAKPQIDIAVVVKDLKSSAKLEEIGYIFKGEFNIPCRYFYGKKCSDIKYNLHVLEEDSDELNGFLLFRDYLRKHPEVVSAYSNLKLEVADKLSSKRNECSLNEYTLAKNEFILSILREAGFKGLCMRFVAHYNEKAYEQNVCHFFQYQPLDSDIRFVFYRGTEIIGYANVSGAEEYVINIFHITSKEDEKLCYDKMHRYLQNRVPTF